MLETHHHLAESGGHIWSIFELTNLRVAKMNVIISCLTGLRVMIVHTYNNFCELTLVADFKISSLITKKLMKHPWPERKHALSKHIVSWWTTVCFLFWVLRLSSVLARVSNDSSLPSAHPFPLAQSSIPYPYLYYPSKILWTKKTGTDLNKPFLGEKP